MERIFPVYADILNGLYPILPEYSVLWHLPYARFIEESISFFSPSVVNKLSSIWYPTSISHPMAILLSFFIFVLCFTCFFIFCSIFSFAYGLVVNHVEASLFLAISDINLLSILLKIKITFPHFIDSIALLYLYDY